MMRYLLPTVCVAIGVLLCSAVIAGIPEPDLVLYGTVTHGGGFVTDGASSGLEIVAKVDGVASPVGTYQMGDNAGATDCGNEIGAQPDADCHVLKIHLESLADGSQRSDGYALVNDVVEFFIKDGPTETPAGAFVVQESGLAQRVNIPFILVQADFDMDGDVDNDDFTTFQNCATGPMVPLGGGVSQACLSSDFDSDNDVDQDDFGQFQLCLSGVNISPDPTCDD